MKLMKPADLGLHSFKKNVLILKVVIKVNMVNVLQFKGRFELY